MKKRKEDKYWECYRDLLDGFKVPRKAKKFIFGHKLTKNRINKKLRLLSGVEHKRGGIEIIGDEFCLECGCRISETLNHPVEYPEVWYDNDCIRCGWNFGGADNSYYRSNLEEFIKIEKCNDNKCCNG